MTHPVEELLNEAGITVGGKQPWDVKVNNPQFLDDILRRDSIGAGESYIKGWWDCDQLDELFFKICRNRLEKKFYSKPKLMLRILKNALFNQQSLQRADEVAAKHYNLGNHLYEKMLGPSMAYTCAYWKEAKNLDEAQFAKYDLVCKKLYLQPGDKVLELGCGWGGLAKHMAEKYGCEVVAMDIGREPANYAKEHCKNLPVQIHHCDYRRDDIYNPKKMQFDKMVSVGVLEHVGYKNYQPFLKLARTYLKEDGLFLLHSIGGNISVNICDPWIDKYIFPNGMLPSIKQLGAAFEKNFVVEDFQNFGQYYEHTLKGWHQNFNKSWPELSQHYDESFRRMMNYYLLSCAGSFRARGMQLWQYVLSPKGKIDGYASIR